MKLLTSLMDETNLKPLCLLVASVIFQGKKNIMHIICVSKSWDTFYSAMP